LNDTDIAELFKEGSMKRRDHKYEVTLSQEQRHVLQQLISSGKAPARKLAHARILLKIDRSTPGPEWTDEQVAEAFEVSRYTVIRIRERFVENGLDDALPIGTLPRPNRELWMENKKRTSSRWRAARVLMGRPTGACVYWLVAWSNWATLSRSAMKP
jgi:hypothetical protein